MKRHEMKAKLMLLFTAGILVLGTSFARAADTTLVGLGKCDKSHQTSLEVKENGKTVTYHLVRNDVSKAFHSKICSKSARIRVTGEVKDVKGEKQVAATKIDLLND